MGWRKFAGSLRVWSSAAILTNGSTNSKAAIGFGYKTKALKALESHRLAPTIEASSRDREGPDGFHFMAARGYVWVLKICSA